MRLSDLDEGTGFTVSKVLIGGEVGKRLADMGFTDGADGALVRGTFMHDPLQIRIRDYDVLIRRSEAHLIEVMPASGTTEGFTDDQQGQGKKTRRHGFAGARRQEDIACRLGWKS
ncbi:MAG: ferrous iron transport protein A [Spirochaetaceae bacterium]|nr:ferrous iron transport protein A [Spirochaetaceae bacterium]